MQETNLGNTLANNSLLISKTLADYLGKAVLILAFVGPLAYCESRVADSRQKTERLKLALQEACIEQRGEWSTWYETCNFEEEER